MTYREQFPDVLADTIAAGFQATASLPLIRADGSLIGAIGSHGASQRRST